MDTKAERLALAVLDAMNRRAVHEVGELVTEDFVDHGWPGGAARGRELYLKVLAFVTTELEVRHEIHDVIADGARVAVRATAHGVHRVDTQGFAPTGKAYAMPVVHWYRADGDRLAEHWGIRDELRAMWQVGAVAPPALPEL